MTMIDEGVTLGQVRNLLCTWPEDRLSNVMVYPWVTALSRVDWTDYRHGLAIKATPAHKDPTQRHVWLLCGVAPLMRADTMPTVWVIDDGARALPFYGSIQMTSRDTRYVGPYALAHPYPVNPDGATTDDGRVIDYMGWMLGPARSWHLKIGDPIDWRKV